MTSESMSRESALLGLLADLYRDRAALQAENARLRQIIDNMPGSDPPGKT